MTRANIKDVKFVRRIKKKSRNRFRGGKGMRRRKRVVNDGLRWKNIITFFRKRMSFLVVRCFKIYVFLIRQSFFFFFFFFFFLSPIYRYLEKLTILFLFVESLPFYIRVDFFFPSDDKKQKSSSLENLKWRFNTFSLLIKF